jgi:hypothetical protein
LVGGKGEGAGGTPSLGAARPFPPAPMGGLGVQQAGGGAAAVGPSHAAAGPRNKRPQATGAQRLYARRRGPRRNLLAALGG